MEDFPASRTLMDSVSSFQSGILLLVLCLIGLGVYTWYKKTEPVRQARERAAVAELEKEAAEVRQAQMRKGTHDQYGYRLCITCNDKVTRATQPAYVVKQSEGFWDLVKRWFGAPARYTIRQLKAKEGVVPVYCDQCSELVRLAHEDYILKYEAKVRQFKRDAAVELRRWLIHGCNDSVAVLIEKHEERVKTTEPQPKRATVVPISQAQNGS